MDLKIKKLEKRWSIVYNEASSMQKFALEKLGALMSEFVSYPLRFILEKDLTKEILESDNIAIIGTPENSETVKKLVESGAIDVPDDDEGYFIKYGNSPLCESSWALICAGKTEKGVMFGVVDLINEYFSDTMCTTKRSAMTDPGFFGVGFVEQTPEFEKKSVPAIKQRAVWTWGHCIYDYRRFFENMILMRLNSIVIWTDFVPVNAKEMVDYAHSLGISVFWGFSWAWDNKALDFDVTSDESLEIWTKKIVCRYENEFLPTGADGIYFQSFTETKNDSIGGAIIAELVTKWVNHISAKLFEKYPNLQLQFGLHATSVKNKLEYIAKVDTRIRIVWEDCGSFPYHYDPKNTADFENTLEFTDNILTLRGENDKFGAVLKGMPTLCWSTFEHQRGAYMIGEQSREFVEKRAAKKRRMWKYIQAYWLENADKVQKTVELMADRSHGEAFVQMLIEDGMLEDRIMFPSALCALMMWEPKTNKDVLIRKAAASRVVYFA